MLNFMFLALRLVTSLGRHVAQMLLRGLLSLFRFNEQILVMADLARLLIHKSL
jgi:hypothetical protein